MTNSHGNDPDFEAMPKWHFFISYTGADKEWAEWIAWTLEEGGYKVLVQAWDFVPGSNWQHQMQQGILHSDRTIAVLSSAYLESVYGQQEWQAAIAADPQGFRRKLIPIRVEDCDRPGMLSAVVSFDLFGLEENATASRLLEHVSTLDGRHKPIGPPRFPGSTAPQEDVDLPDEPPRQQSQLDDSPIEISTVEVLGPFHQLSRRQRFFKLIDISLAFSRNGKLLVASDEAGSVRVWCLRGPQGSPDLRSHLPISGKAPTTVACTDDGRLIAAQNRERVELYWLDDGRSQGVACSTQTPDSLLARVSFLGSRKFLLTGTKEAGVVALRSTEDLSIVGNLSHEERVFSASASLKGDMVACLVRNRIVLWDVRDPASPVLQGDLGQYSDGVGGAGFANEDAFLVLQNGCADIWRISILSPPKLVSRVQIEGAQCVDLSPCGQYLASHKPDVIQIHDLTSTSRKSPLHVTPHERWASSTGVGFIGGRNRLVSFASDGRVVLYQTNL